MSNKLQLIFDLTIISVGFIVASASLMLVGITSPWVVTPYVSTAMILFIIVEFGKLWLHSVNNYQQSKWEEENEQNIVQQIQEIPL